VGAAGERVAEAANPAKRRSGNTWKAQAVLQAMTLGRLWGRESLDDTRRPSGATGRGA
jgi:hypothetical protein